VCCGLDGGWRACIFVFHFFLRGLKVKGIDFTASMGWDGMMARDAWRYQVISTTTTTTAYFFCYCFPLSSSTAFLLFYYYYTRAFMELGLGLGRAMEWNGMGWGSGSGNGVFLDNWY
jgi:hypothetical protein